MWIDCALLSVPGSVGFITLFGVAVLNGVVMVEQINQQIEENRAITTEAVTEIKQIMEIISMTADNAVN